MEEVEVTLSMREMLKYINKDFKREVEGKGDKFEKKEFVMVFLIHFLYFTLVSAFCVLDHCWYYTPCVYSPKHNSKKVSSLPKYLPTRWTTLAKANTNQESNTFLASQTME